MNIPVTEWFPAEVKPKYPGIYKTNADNDSRSYQYWTGEHWGLQGYENNFWPYMKDMMMDQSMYQEVKWRGLTSPHPEWKP